MEGYCKEKSPMEHKHKWKLDSAVRNRIKVHCVLPGCTATDGNTNKYNNTKTVIDGIKFDSKQEGLYYVSLKQRLKDGEIKKFDLQPAYELLPKIPKVNRAIVYYGDFLIYHNDGTKEIVDVKGVKTAVFQLKYNLLLHKLHTDPKYKQYRFTLA